MIKKKSILIFFIFLLSGFILLGCNEKEATYIEITSEKKEVLIEDTLNLKVNTDGNGTITWSSSDDNIASVSNLGVLSAISVGEVIITATIDSISSNITITVISDEEPIVIEENEPTKTLVIHYFRPSNDYQKWAIWLWSETPFVGGSQYSFDVNDKDELIMDSYGSVTYIDITSKFENTTKLGIIIKSANSWDLKDVGYDRFVDVPKETPGGKLHIYMVEDDPLIGLSVDDENGPFRGDKIKNAYFTDEKTIYFTTTSRVEPSNIKLKVDNEELNITPIFENNIGKFILPSSIEFSKSYIVEASFTSGLSTYSVTYAGLYNTKAFEDAFGYDGRDLGATISENTTTFKIWAPISTKVVLNLYKSGTPKEYIALDDTATDTPYKKIELSSQDKGVWETAINENLHGTYYTYTITNGVNEFEIVDPYAKSAGVSGKRGMVVDFSQTNPEGYSYNNLVDNIENATDAIIYELHVRDLTSHSSWSGPSDFAGKFMGFTIENTTYSKDDITVTTGLDHISELGVTHVQILPFYDQANDEANSPDKFNWGYNPLNYNVLEGSYSTNPFDGTVRILEFKKLIMALQNKGINVIMDVVYNHVSDAGSSNFEKILPGYFFRLNSTGGYSNGSGCGNETASDRLMMRKFIIDSTEFYAKEYNISGFRFDLMALHDIETMKAVETNLKEINDKILIYGEPWTGGTSTLSSELCANKDNLSKIGNVAAFNDDFRDAVKGTVWTSDEGGYVQGNISPEIINKISYGIVGGISYDGLDTSCLSYKKAWNSSPLKTINYVSCHDNNTLYDKIMLSTTIKQKIDGLIKYMFREASAMVFTSQGIVFFQGGDEFMRSKPKVSGGYDSNSYESPDSTNQFRYDYKIKTDNLETFNYYKGLIQIRKNYSELRFSSVNEIQNNIKFITISELPNIIAYVIDTQDNASYNKLLIIHNSTLGKRITLPEGKWNIICNRDKCGLDIINTTTSNTLYIEACETLILYQ